MTSQEHDTDWELTYMLHAQGTATGPPGSAAEPATGQPQERQPWERLKDKGAARTLVGVIVAGTVVIASIGFAGSYAAVRDLALHKGFGWFANVFPIGIDAGIVVLLALDLLLTWFRIPFPLLRQTAWLLTAATIAFNGASAWPDPLGVGMHAVIPVLFVVSVEAARHAIGRTADITADKHMEGVRITRWLLAPVPTFLLWRRMKLWELRSYDQVIKLEQERLVYQARLRSRFGRGWRRKAPVESLMPLRLARYGVPLAETGPAGLAAAGIEFDLQVMRELPTGSEDNDRGDVVDLVEDEPDDTPVPEHQEIEPVTTPEPDPAPAAVYGGYEQPEAVVPPAEPMFAEQVEQQLHAYGYGNGQGQQDVERYAAPAPYSTTEQTAAPVVPVEVPEAQQPDVEAQFAQYGHDVGEHDTFPNTEQLAAAGASPAAPARSTRPNRVQAKVEDDQSAAAPARSGRGDAQEKRRRLRELMATMRPEELEPLVSRRAVARVLAPQLGLKEDAVRGHLKVIAEEDAQAVSQQLPGQRADELSDAER
ncbi:DUF2637 domain-containing protein [Streptantibioticus rubrisoli]|uniref:DUF2637 domain-containing protein n=1 Tax=Streptantibioticus rubrisoli TaxID=1387313 RepID=A0ABT1PKB5_9ACTN|nr:DUF2637 domain-containing protein [Streptantibioticus rubrisoli]MCQ4045814.1 DUF2637 domain-containing protein [Streptantibioticus rubrisoli]